MNRKFGLNVPIDNNTLLANNDFVGAIKYLINLQNYGKTDDIDHLANRRLRCVGELVNQTSFKAGLSFRAPIKENVSG